MFMRWFGQRKPIISQSPAYRFSKTNFTALEVWSQNMDNTNSVYGVYTPYNYIQITNGTGASLTITFSDGTIKAIPSGTILSFGSDVIPAFSNFQIQGDAAGNTGVCEVIVQKVIDYKEAIRLNSGVSIYG